MYGQNAGGMPPAYWGNPVATTPTVGQLAEMVLRLSPEDRTVFDRMVGAGVAAGPSSGMTTRPSDGRVFRLTAPRERSEAYKRLELAEKRASDALRAYVQSHGWTIQPAEIQQTGGVTTVTSPTKVLDATGLEANDAGATRHLNAVQTAKQAVKAYRRDHPDEFRPPAPSNRGGRGRGRGRGAPS